MWPRRLKLGIQENSRGMSLVYRNRAAAAYLFLFLSLQFTNIKILVTLLSGTVCPRKLKLSTHVNNGWMCGVYWNQAAAYSSL